MRLKKIKIFNRFKNLDNFTIDFSNKNGITVLIGANGSGKSNILEAISGIFAGLYNQKYKTKFNYELSYVKDTYKVEIKYINGVITMTKINGTVDNLKPEHLPNQVISSYSGEESRLWTEYYEPFHQDYIKALRGVTLPNSNLTYINKEYWNIALLTFYFYDMEAFTDIRDFCQNMLGISTLNYVKFSFDIAKLNSWKDNPVTNFVKQLNPENGSTLQIDLATLKTRLNNITEIDFFRYLAAAFIPKDEKLITGVELNINNNLSADCLSEGEKKLLLVKLILEVIGDENSLILLDEPDSHIHISRKASFKTILDQYTNRENIITTHSPTLTHCFDDNHITMLTKNVNNDVQIVPKQKQAIIQELTGGMWSYQQQNIFLNSTNDLLLVEGKTDEIFLRKALSILQKTEARFDNLQFEYLPCGGASGVKLLLTKFQPKPGQKIIVFFDRDKSGWDAVNGIFEDGTKYNHNSFGDFKKKEGFHIAVFPIRAHFRGGANFNIEDYFPKKLLNKYALMTFKSLNTLITKDAFKTALANDCQNFEDKNFKNFEKVFDLILKIKLEAHSV